MHTCTPEVARIAAAHTGHGCARPHLTHHDMADITALEAARQCYPDERGARDPAPSITALVARAAVSALAPADTSRCALVIADQSMTDMTTPDAAAAPGLCPPGGAAVLAVGRARVYPVEWEGILQKRLYLPLSLTYDPRMLASADAARLTRAVAALLANPLRLLMAS